MISDSNRAYETACTIMEGRNIPIIKEERLREMNIGLWEDREVAALWDEPFVSQTSLSIVEIEEGRGIIKAYAETPHLEKS